MKEGWRKTDICNRKAGFKRKKERKKERKKKERKTKERKNSDSLRKMK